MTQIHFAKATLPFYDTILTWLDASHVKTFWESPPEHRQDILLFMQGREVPSPYADGIFTYWLGFFDAEPFCMIMTSEMIDDANLPSYYKQCISQTGKTYSIDFMIGSKKHFGQGLAALTLEAFMQFMRESDPSIDTFMIDPEEANVRAKHVYEKAGFHTLSTFVCARGSRGSSKDLKHFLMIKRFKK